MGHDVFVSHSSHDKAAADAVCAALEANGIRCWIAPRDIIPGENWATSILKGVSQCRLTVLVFSAQTNSSQHIRREVERAVHHGIPIAPIRIQDALPADDLEYFLSSSHWMDALTPPFEQHLRDLANKTRALLEMLGHAPTGVPNLTTAAPPVAVPPVAMPPVAPPSVRRRKLVPALLGAAMLIGVAAWIWHGDLSRLWSNAGKPNAPKPPASVAQNTAPILPAPATPATLPGQIVLSHPVDLQPQMPEAPARNQQEQQLQALKDLFEADHLTPEQYKLGQVLFKSKSGELDEYDTARRVQFVAVLEGRLTPDKLAAALAAIETPEQKTARVAREETDRKEALRRDRVARLLAAAKVDDTPDKGTEGLALLDDLLKLDPDNPDAISLKTHIQSMLAEAERQRLAQLRQQKIAQLLATAKANVNVEHAQAATAALDETLQIDPGNSDARALQQQIQKLLADAAAKQRQEKVAGLLATAKANDSKEKGHDALPALDDLLKLDPANADALALRNKIVAYYKITNSIGMTFIEIKPGEFLMGSPANEERHETGETQHKVKITKPFMLGVTPVTQKQWVALMGNNPSYFKGDDLPVDYVSCDEVVAFCKKLSAKEGKKYRLPTEAEWEYACRAGTTTPYNTGDGEKALADAGWYDNNSGPETHPVGQKKANAWGLYDMHGNVCEWCSDWYGPYPAGDAVDPTGPAEDASSSRVMRGGSFIDSPQNCRAACRGRFTSGLRLNYVGFRCVLDVP